MYFIYGKVDVLVVVTAWMVLSLCYILKVLTLCTTNAGRRGRWVGAGAPMGAPLFRSELAAAATPRSSIPSLFRR
jgi:hypothetical protein